MLIKCTSCGTQAKIPESKEGAKVKCPSCGHVYVARQVGARGRAKQQQDPTRYVIIGGAVVAAGVIGILASRGGDEPARAQEPEPEPKVAAAAPQDLTSWDGVLLTMVRGLHTAAAAGNGPKLQSALDAEGAYAFWPDAPQDPVPPKVPAEGEGDGAAEAATPAAPRPAWSALDPLARVNFTNDMVARATQRDPDGAVALWKPYDGSVADLDEEHGRAQVIVKSQCTDASLGLDDRATEWRLHADVRADGSLGEWRWVWVGRYYTDAERDRLSRGPRKKPTKTTLSDGSVVYESEIRPIPFDEGLPAAEQTRLTGLVDLIADPEMSGRALTQARDEVLAAGKPIVPALLTKVAQVVEGASGRSEFTNDEKVVLQLLHATLFEITGHQTTLSFVMGADKERNESGLKQWFAWYDKKYKRFEGPSEPDASDADAIFLDDPDYQPSTDRERALYEKAKREREQREKDQ